MTVLSDSTVVSIRFHTFQLQVRGHDDNKTATVVFAPDRVHVSQKHIIFEAFIFWFCFEVFWWFCLSFCFAVFVWGGGREREVEGEREGGEG